MLNNSIINNVANRWRYYAITVVFFIVTIVLASFGNIYNTIFQYPGDLFFFVLFLWLGYKLVYEICRLTQNGHKLKALLWTFLYFFMAFVVFSDGHGSVEHSHSLYEKILLIPVTTKYFLKSIFLPLIFLVVAWLHNVIMYLVCEPCEEDITL